MKFIQSCSVEEVLSKNKLPGVTFHDSMAESYRLYTTGLSVKEIAIERHLAFSSIFNHLCDCIKFGKPVKLVDLTVTKNIRNTIISVIRGPLINSKMTRLKPIKNVCPKIFTYSQIRAVTAFLQVCDHLDRFNCEYEDFKNVMISGNETEEPESDGEGEKMIKELDSLVDELKMDDTFLGNIEVSVTDNCEQFILNNFGRQKLSKNLDSCDKKIPDKCEGLNEEGLYDFTDDSHTFLAAVDAMGGNYSLSMCIAFLKGSNSNSKLCDKHRSRALFGSGKHKSYKWWKCIGHILQREAFLGSQISLAGLFPFIVIYVSAKGERFLRNVIERPKSTKILLNPSREMLELQKSNLLLVPNAAQPLTLSSTDTTSSNLLQKHNNTNTEHFIENETGKHFYNLTPSPNLLRKENNTNTEYLIENEIGKQERMHFYNLTPSPKRTEIATRLDLMPYTIASNEALMKMAWLKPHNIDALQKCQVEGYTEDQMIKFGEEFIKVIPFTSPLSVEEVLSKNPLIKLTTFAAECYRLYTTGLPVQEIAKQKHLAFSIVLSHLCDCIKAGKPVNLVDLSVTKCTRDRIISVIRSPFINSDMTVLTAIKNRCPEIITYNQIRATVAFLQVCDHLDQFNCEYEDFKNAMIDPNYSVQFYDEHESVSNVSMVEINDNEMMKLDTDGEDTEQIDFIHPLEVCEACIVKTEDVDVGIETINPPVNEPSPKKMRLDLSLLDSPPRIFD